MSCATCRAMSAHASRRCVRSSSLRWLLQVGRHLIEVVDQPTEFVGGGGRDARVEVAARDPPGRTRQPVDGIRDPLCHPVAERAAEQAEEDRAKEHPSIELVDLLLDFLLTERHWHRHDALAPARADRRRGDEIVDGTDVLYADVGRRALEDDAPVDVGRRAGRAAAATQTGRVRSSPEGAPGRTGSRPRRSRD